MKRIKIWKLFVLIIPALIMISSCEKDDIKYELEFDIEVPEDWIYTEYYFNDLVRYEAFSPDRLEDDMALVDDTLTETMIIYRIAYSPAIDLDVFYTAITAELSKQPNFQIFYSSDTTVNGENAKKLIHLQTIRKPISVSPTDSVDIDIKPMKLFFYKNDYGYLIDCTIVPYTYDYYKPIFEEDIIPTFVFKE